MDKAQDLQNALQSLDQIIKDKAQSLHDNLADGATDKQIVELQSEFNNEITPCIEQWFRWRNGSIKQFSEIIPLGELVSIEQVVEYRNQLKNSGLKRILRFNSVLLLEDGAGDGYFVDLQRSPPEVYYEMLEDPTPTYYGTMFEFVRYITEGYKSGVFSIDDDGELECNDELFERYEESHLEKTDRS